LKLDRSLPTLPLRLIPILVVMFSLLLGWSSSPFDAVAEQVWAESPSQRLDPPEPYMLYIPLVIVPSRSPSDLEITQAVQQPGNPVTLISGRTTIVRYTLTDTTPHTGVNAQLYGYRDGFPLPGSPISALNNPRTLEASANRADWNDTFNFELPAAWTSGTIDLWGAASNGTTYEVVQGSVSATFHENDPLAIMVVPIAYTCTSGGSGTVAPDSPYDYLDDDAYKLYPVPSTDLQVHAPVAYAGPCLNGQPYPSYNTTDGGDWADMLYAIRDVWNVEGRPNRYYYGLVEIYCGGSCTAGLGYIGYPKVAVGWNGSGFDKQEDASSTHAHEVGHNHGLPHAPGCSASNPDPGYPYADGRIGDAGSPNYGYDIVTDGIKAYPSYYDYMTYCSAEWISDYNYEKLYTWELVQPATAPVGALSMQDALLVSGSLREDGSVELKPTFRLDLPVSPLSVGSYDLELLDADGKSLGTHQFEMVTAAVDGIGGAQGGEIQGFQLTIPYTAGIEQVRVVKEGQVLGILVPKPVPPGLDFAPPQARLEQGLLRATWGGVEGLSYLVRLSLDGGDTWQTVGVNLKHPALDLPLPSAVGADLRLEILASDGIHTRRLELGSDATLR
jgi:hypothetical protein